MRRTLQLALAVIMMVGMWYYIHAVLIPYQKNQAAADQVSSRRTLGDLFPRWLGTRELLLHGRDPYSLEITREIQMAIYGQPLNGNQHIIARDEQRFAYPAYVVFLLAPTIDLPFPLVRDLFRVLLLALTAASIPLWARALRLQMSYYNIAIFALLAVGSYPVVQGLYLEQLTLLVCFLIAASCTALASGMLVPAGILLALATIKPQLIAGVVVWLAVWTMGDWKRRKQFAWAFLFTVALLWLGAEWILPGWLGRWWAAMHAYLGYNDSRSLLEILFGRIAGIAFSAVIVFGVAWICWRLRRAAPASDAFNACLVSTLAAGLLLKPKFPLYDVAILVPAIMLLWSRRKSLWERGLGTRVFVSIAAFVVLWQWMCALALVAVSALSPSTAQNGWKLPVAALFYLPVVLAGLLGLLTVDLLTGRSFFQTTTGASAVKPGISFAKTSALNPAAAHQSVRH